MNDKMVVRMAMKSRGISQNGLAEMLGYKNQSAISNRLNGGNMRVDTFVKLLDVLGYEVIVREKKEDIATNETRVTV